MLFFVMVFPADFNPNVSEENSNEYNTLIEYPLHIEQSSINENRDRSNHQQNINQTGNSKNKTFSDMNSKIKEKQDSFRNEIGNNSKNENTSNTLHNRDNNINVGNPEIVYSEKEHKTDSKKILVDFCLLDVLNQYEQYVSSNNFNEEVVDPMINFNEKVLPNHLSNHDKTPSTKNIVLESHIENKIEKNSVSASSKTLNDQTQYISDVNMQDSCDINDRESALVREIILDNISLAAIPDITSYKECLESLSMKNNHITKVTEIIEKLKFLKKLDLSHNRIYIIDCKMKNMKLEWLDLSYNYLTYLNCKPIFAMTTLKYLNLQSNGINLIIEFKSKGLEILSLRGNLMAYVPKSIITLKSLRQLDLSCNRINKICNTMKNMKLEWLDLSYNYLTYLHCKSIFVITTLKYLNLQNNDITFLIEFKSKGLESLNISNNPISCISRYFYELPNIIELYMSNLQLTNILCFDKVSINLKVLDLSNNQLHKSVSNIERFYALEELNLSDCRLIHVSMCSKMLYLKKLNLSRNLIKVLPIYFINLKCNIKTLDLTENPLKVLSTENSLGGLDILACYYGRVALNKSILRNIIKLSSDQIFFQKKHMEKLIYFKKIQKNKINDEVYKYMSREILENSDKEIKKKVAKIMMFLEDMKNSGFINLGEIMKEVTKIIKVNDSKHQCMNRVIDYLNTKFSLKFYNFLDNILSKYKLERLKLALVYVYDSDKYLNYWMYYFRDILSFSKIKQAQKNPKIHNDKNIILSSFMNITDSDDLVHILKLELKKNKEMTKIANKLLGNKQEQARKRLGDGTLKPLESINDDSIKYFLKMYQIIC